MKGCVVGGGPAGIFVSKYLSKNGIFVDLFEKECELLGNYRMAKERIDISKCIENDSKINIKMNSDESCINDADYDFYVVSTGGIPKQLNIKGKEHVRSAIDIIKEIYGIKSITLNKSEKGNNKKATLVGTQDLASRIPTYIKDKKIIIIGMGNVCLDLISYVGNYVKEITVLCRSSLLNSPFDNHLLREIVNSNVFNIKLNNVKEKIGLDDLELAAKNPSQSKTDTVKLSAVKRNDVVKSSLEVQEEYIHKVTDNTPIEDESKKRKILRRLTIVQKLLNKPILQSLYDCLFSLNQKPKLNLIFDSNILEVNKKKVKYSVGSFIKEQSVDLAISSIGFIPNLVKIDTLKPIYYAGWCSVPTGNLGIAMIDAKNVVDTIVKDMQLTRSKQKSCYNKSNEQVLPP